jgi:hypothetical protein
LHRKLREYKARDAQLAKGAANHETQTQP